MSFTNYTVFRRISLSVSHFKKVPDNLKGRSKSSQEWLIRQINDPYVRKAKMENYRARSAFKLIEIDDKYHILKPGNIVIECGAAPGAWTQVSVARINANGLVQGKPKGKHIAIDLLPMHNLEGASIISPADFTLLQTQERVTALLTGQKVDVILSDMAPSASGIKELDQDCIFKLAYSVLNYTKRVANDGAKLLIKVWAGGQTKKLEEDLGKLFSSVKIIKPPSSRQNSSEMFLLAIEYKGNKDG